MASPEDEEPVPKRQRRLGPRLCPPVPSPPSPLLVSIGQDLATRCTITTGLPWRMKCDHTGACSSAVPNIARGIASCWPVWRGCSTAIACKNATHPIFGGIRRPFCPGDHWKTPYLLFSSIGCLGSGLVCGLHRTMGDDISDDDRWLVEAVEIRKLSCQSIVNGMSDRLKRHIPVGVYPFHIW